MGPPRLLIADNNLGLVSIFGNQHKVLSHTLLVRKKKENTTKFWESITDHSKSNRRDLDKTLLEIGLYAIKALVVRIATRAVEGIIVGGSLDALFEIKKEQKYLSILIGALIGGAVGNLIEKGTLELVANKAPSGWTIERFTT